MKKLLLILAMAGCQNTDVPRHFDSRVTKDECDSLARKYGANVVTIRDGNDYRGYASLHSLRLLWKSSGEDVTKCVQAPTPWQVKLVLADEMRPGVMENPNPPRHLAP